MSLKDTVYLPAGYALTLVSDANSLGTYLQLANPGEATNTPADLAVSTTVVIGPFNSDRMYQINSTYGQIVNSIALSGELTAADDASVALLAPKASPTFTGTVVLPATTSIGTTTATELGYVHSVTSAIQTQLNAKEALLNTGGVKAAGASGTAGSFKSFPATGSKGSLAVVAVANTGDTITTISNAAMAQASVISIPDPGAATDTFVLKAANDTNLALKAPLASPTFTGTVVLPATTSIDTVSATEISYLDGVTSALQTQLNAKAPSASPTFTSPTLGVAAATSINFGGSSLATYKALTAFTPTLTFAVIGDLSWSYDAQIGFYLQIGGIVFYYMYIIATPTFTTASGALQIGALPVGVNAANPIYPMGSALVGCAGAWPTSVTVPYCVPAAGTTYAYILGSGSGVGNITPKFDATSFPTGQQFTLLINGFYMV